VGRKYPFKTTPRPHQVKALRKVVKNNGGGLFMPMRSGKTKVAIDWACAMNMKHGVRKVLVVTHTPTTFGVWKLEIRKHCPFPYVTYVLDDEVDRYKTSGPPLILFLIVNVQQVYDRIPIPGHGRRWDPGDPKWLYDWKPEAIIVDESTTIGDPTTVQSRKLYKLQENLNVQCKLILSGTPLHRNLFMAFGQFKFLDETLFGTAWGAFKETYGLFGGYQKTKLLKYRNVKRFRRKISPIVFQMKHVPLVPAIHQVRPVQFEPKAEKLYRQMELHRLISIEEQDVSAQLIITQLLKLAQMASGFVRSDAGRWYRVSHAKRQAFGSLLDDYEAAGKRKIIVFSRFLPTLRDISIEAKSHGYRTLLLHGGIKSPIERERRYVKFQEDPGKWIFVSQISAGSMGIDLSEADTTCYYSLTESLLHYDQSMARMRKYKETRTLAYDYLLTQGTVDELMYLALKDKKNLVDFVLDHPQLIHWQEHG
jgi:superfamily II DNA or RNA helicase